MFQRVEDANFISGEHEVLRFWTEQDIFGQLLRQNRGKPKWSFLDGPMTANNPMGVHHAWGRTYKDAYQRYFAMTGHELRYQNGFDCQGLWVEVEVEKELKLGTKKAIESFGIDRFVQECKKRVLRFAARQTEQSIRLGYWMQWDEPEELRKLAEAIGKESSVQSPVSSGGENSSFSRRPAGAASAIDYRTANGTVVTGDPELITGQLGNPAWGGSYFTFSTNNNETIWKFLKKCFDRKKVYRGHDVMPWGGRSGSAYSQMEVADGRKLTTHRSCFVRFPLLKESRGSSVEGLVPENSPALDTGHSALDLPEYLLIWTTTPWTLTSNVAAAVNPDLEYVAVKAQLKGDSEPAIYYFAKENLNTKRLEKEFKEGFGRPEWQWPDGVGKLKNIAQIFKEQGGFEELRTLKGAEMVGWRYAGPFDELLAQRNSYRDTQVRFTGDNLTTAFGREIRREYDSMIEFLGDEKSSKPRDEIEVILRRNNGDYRSAMEEIQQVFANVVGRTKSNVALALRAADFRFDDDEFRVLNFFQIQDTLERAFDRDLDESTWKLATIAEAFAEEKSWGDIKEEDFPEVARAAVSGCKQVLYTAWPLALHEKLSTPATAHRVIDGGRDSKGNANVVAGEGTGIVHIAPGCGDIDHKIGMELGLPVIAPLLEDGTYDQGFGIFTGKDAITPSTADLVFEELKKKNLLVAVETYPHVYPHCWRTGDELVFRLVDEWFINMDWRDEIKEVTKCINWLPDSINGQQRELEWLTIMSDWMVSKKRFWGLALPIWIEEANPQNFVVFGSVAELKEWYDQCGGEGWEKFEGHTPHRPWIDAVRIRNQSDNKSGAWMKRIEDVGNPWLDAGIVPFSTLGYSDSLPRTPGGERLNDPLDTGHSTLDWHQWFPADLVTECFPGQFRNWFYSMLSLATMMRHDETDDPQEKKPFKNLLGHRLVMDENGNPMHKSDGTAIWFEEAAEQLGVDTLRWMYLAQNPAVDLRFGTRHKDQPVALQTPDGPISQTKEGLPTCKVTSKPADEVRRQALIPLWNSYAFFVNYAVLDGFVPPLEYTLQGDSEQKRGSLKAGLQQSQPLVPYAQRPEIDRWVLSRLQELIGTARTSFEKFDAPNFMASAAEFIDDLSNWYIRRNRRRFWKAVGASGGRESSDVSEADRGADTPRSPTWDPDKLSAYQTLYEVLLTLSKLLAPATPFLSERMYRNLVGSRDGGLGSRGNFSENFRVKYRESLESRGVPMTPERATMIDAISDLGSRFDLEQVVASLAASEARLSRSTIARRLQELEVAGILRRAVESGSVTYERIEANAPSIPEVDLDTVEIPADVWDVVPMAFAVEHSFVPVGWEGSTLVVAVPEPSEATFQKLKSVLGRDLKFMRVDKRKLHEVFQSLVTDVQGFPLRFDNCPPSVHLCPYPEVDPSKFDPELNWKTHQVQTLIRMAHRLRETAELRVRQPLAELRFASSDARQAAALEQYADIIADELNVKKIVRSQNLDDLVTYAFKPNLKTLGPKYGKLLNVIKNGLAAVDPKLVAPLRAGQPVTVTFEGNEVTLAPEDVMVSVQQASDWASADDAGIQIALSTKLTPELVREGMARDLIRHIQQLRKDADLEENQRIRVMWNLSEPEASAPGPSATGPTSPRTAMLPQAIGDWQAAILAETRADEIVMRTPPADESKSVSVGDDSVRLWITPQ